MMYIFMWLFVNDFGFVNGISGLFLVLFVSLLLLFCFFIVSILMYLFEKTCLLKLFKDIVHLHNMVLNHKKKCWPFASKIKDQMD